MISKLPSQFFLIVYIYLMHVPELSLMSLAAHFASPILQFTCGSFLFVQWALFITLLALSFHLSRVFFTNFHGLSYKIYKALFHGVLLFASCPVFIKSLVSLVHFFEGKMASVLICVSKQGSRFQYNPSICFFFYRLVLYSTPSFVAICLSILRLVCYTSYRSMKILQPIHSKSWSCIFRLINHKIIFSFSVIASVFH